MEFNTFWEIQLLYKICELNYLKSSDSTILWEVNNSFNDDPCNRRGKNEKV